MKDIHCVCCRKTFDSKDEEIRLDSGFSSRKCPYCGYENTIEIGIDLARNVKEGGPY